VAHDAFISYSNIDKAIADAACAALENAGIRCWIAPRDIMPSIEYAAAIVHAIDRSRVLVLIFSSNANSSPHISREVERALSKSIPILPMRIEDVPPKESLAYYMESVHWLDALTPPLEKHLHRLVESVRALLEANASEPLPTKPSPIDAPAGKAAVQPAASAGMGEKSVHRRWPLRIIIYWVAPVLLSIGVGFATIRMQLPFQNDGPPKPVVPDNLDDIVTTDEIAKLWSFTFIPNKQSSLPKQWQRRSEAGVDYWVALFADDRAPLHFDILRRIRTDDGCVGTIVALQQVSQNQLFIPDKEDGCQNHELLSRESNFGQWQDLGEVDFGK
jgi:hypothetical protein